MSELQANEGTRDYSDDIMKANEARYEIDALIQLADKLRVSPECTLAWRSLQMAKSWIGKYKGKLGAINPYIVVDKAEKIPTTAEVAERVKELPEDHLAAINMMRKDIDGTISKFFYNTWLDEYEKFAKKHLMEARFWYGFELQRLRENAK